MPQPGKVPAQGGTLVRCRDSRQQVSICCIEGQIVRVISWNVQRRVGDGLRRQVEALAGRAADLVALQEVPLSNGPPLREQLRQAGWEHVEYSLERVAEARADRRRSFGGVPLAFRWPLR